VFLEHVGQTAVCLRCLVEISAAQADTQVWLQVSPLAGHVPAGDVEANARNRDNARVTFSFDKWSGAKVARTTIIIPEIDPPK
jgi:hypothetical protein